MTAPLPKMLLFVVGVTAKIGIAGSFSPLSSAIVCRPISEAFSPHSRWRPTPSSILMRVAPRRPMDSNWEDDTKSSRANADVTDYAPPWRDHQQPKAATSGSRAIPKKDMPLPKFARGGGDIAAPMPNGAGSAKGAAPSSPGGSYANSGGGAGSSSGTADAAAPMLRNISWPLIRDPPGVGPDYPLSYARAFVTILSTVFTWHLHVHNGHSSVLASSSLALLVSTCLDRRLGQAAFCGSFAGMSGSHLVPNYATSAMLGAMTSIAYEIFIHARNACSGIGGRLGATAFLATYALSKYRGVVGVTRRVGRRGLRRVVAGGPGAMGSGVLGGGIFGDPILVSMVLYHVLGAIITISLRESSDDSAASDPVRACSVVGLLGSLFLKNDPTAMLALYGGSFVGMSLPSRLMHGNIASDATSVIRPQTPLMLFGSFAGAGALAGLFHALTIRYGYWNGGWGGKAGLCAFAGCWAYRGFGNVVDVLRKKRKK